MIVRDLRQKRCGVPCGYWFAPTFLVEQAMRSSCGYWFLLHSWLNVRVYKEVLSGYIISTTRLRSLTMIVHDLRQKRCGVPCGYWFAPTFLVERQCT
ncbi:hypothetical protein J6590_053041 [Homalodisca vitripennis]|nr:hypothetical protein J6590_053041 [Homalodisca vitripennis]